MSGRNLPEAFYIRLLLCYCGYQKRTNCAERNDFIMIKRLVLASSSPRRRELLEQIGLHPEIIPSTVEEKVTDTDPVKVVESLSLQKAGDVAEKCRKDEPEEETVIIGADTVVAIDGRILGKPRDREDALRMINLIQGRTHQVYTGVTLIVDRNGKERVRTFSEETHVTVYPMDEKEIQDYVSSGEPDDKAGAYGIQGRFAAYIKKINGDYSNVVGLPAGRVCQELKAIFQEMESIV